MRRFILLVFIGVLLTKNVTPLKNRKYPSRLTWLFGNKQDEQNETKKNEQNEEKENEQKEENKPTVCQSQECKKIARIITESMDKSVDPCDDFYEYACGKWSEHNPAPKGVESWSMFASAQINVLKQIKEIFDEGPKEDDLLAVKLAKKWYAVCMDTDEMDEQGLEPIVFTMSRIGGWPMIMEPDEWNQEEYSWQKVDDQYVRLTGRNAFHDVRVIESYCSNESQKIVHIDTPHLPPASFKLWGGIDDSEEEKDKSDEDLSDEEKQNDEQKDSQEPGNEDKDDNKSDNNSSNDDNNDDNDDDDDDDNNDDDDDDNNDEDNGNNNDENDENNDNNDDENHDDNEDNDNKDDDNNDDKNNDEDDNNNTNEQNDVENAKKRVSEKRPGKFAKNKKLGHSRKIKNSTHSKKHNYKMKKERIKRRAISTNVHEKLRTRKAKNHVKQTHRNRPGKTLEATPQITKETIYNYDVVKQYTDYISKVARAIAKARRVEISEEHMNKDIQDMIKFHVKLTDITTEKGEEEELTLNDFQAWYEEKRPKSSNSAIDWLYKIGELFDEAHVPVDGDLNVKIRKPVYFERLIPLLDDTSSRTIVNYIHWNFLSRIIRTTTKEMRKLYNAWEEKEKTEEIFGIPARSFKCTTEVNMADILAYEYVRNHFSDEIIITASDMMDDIQKEVEYQIKKSDWIDEDTKDFVLAKLVNMEKFIGYPDWYKNNTAVKQYYQGLIIGNSYYENTLSYERYSKWKRLRKLMKEDEDDQMMTGMSTVMVNAFFSPDLNSVAFSAADFQSPLFAFGRPQAINYGIIGTIMGHEVNHGFDDSGHLYDKKGEVVEWLSAMAEAYGKRAECFIEQFNNYAIDKASNYKIKDYGNQTIGENIADTMGLEAAYRAYQRRERECGKPNTVLPGHENLTNDQLFFLSFANLWCEAEVTNTTINEAKADVHSTGRLRVIGAVSNVEDFAKAYNCPVDSAMNPKKKCHIWK